MKTLKILLLTFIAILVAFRIAFPHYLLKYVVNQVNKIPQYKVQIADLDVHLYRGAYTLKKIELWKVNKNIPVPFFAAQTIDFSIDWRSLLHGKVLAKITIQKPKINFVTDPTSNDEQITISKQWLDVVKSLYPANINKLDVIDGKISFRSYKGNPPFNIYIQNSSFTMLNMQKATKENSLLSSSFQFKGDVIGGGNVNVVGKYDPFNKIPTFEMKVKLTSLQVSQVASFLKHYSSINVSGGTFSLYGKTVAANGQIEGELKPFIKNLKVGSPKETNPLKAVVDGAVSVVAKILENSDKKTIATKIKISGKVDEPDTSIWSIIGYLIHHGFIQALLPQIDTSVKMADVLYPNQKTSSQFPSYHH